MFSPDNFNPFLKEIMNRLSGQSTCNGSDNMKNSSNNKKSSSTGINITPSQALVIAGIIGGALEVTSILVDKEQLVQIVLSGSLKKKTELDKLLDQVGQMPFEDVMKALLQKLT